MLKVLDSKNKVIKKPSDQDTLMNPLQQNLPIEMQQTFAMNIPMQNQQNEHDDGDEEEPDMDRD